MQCQVITYHITSQILPDKHYKKRENFQNNKQLSTTKPRKINYSVYVHHTQGSCSMILSITTN